MYKYIYIHMYTYIHIYTHIYMWHIYTYIYIYVSIGLGVLCWLPSRLPVSCWSAFHPSGGGTLVPSLSPSPSLHCSLSAVFFKDSNSENLGNFELLGNRKLVYSIVVWSILTEINSTVGRAYHIQERITVFNSRKDQNTVVLLSNKIYCRFKFTIVGIILKIRTLQLEHVWYRTRGVWMKAHVPNYCATGTLTPRWVHITILEN